MCIRDSSTVELKLNKIFAFFSSNCTALIQHSVLGTKRSKLRLTFFIIDLNVFFIFATFFNVFNVFKKIRNVFLHLWLKRAYIMLLWHSLADAVMRDKKAVGHVIITLFSLFLSLSACLVSK